MEVYGVIYLLLNKVNGKPYVRQTTQKLKKRLNGHLHGDLYVDRAIRKYKPENFRCDILKICYSESELNAWEKFFIAALKTKAPYGYNLTDGGEGCNPTSETRAKMSAARTGKRHTAESKAKMSAARTGRRHTAETRVKIFVSHRSDSPFKNLLREIDAHHLTYTTLAKLMGLARISVSAKMRGKRNFTEDDKAKLVEIFGKPIEYLLESEFCFQPRDWSETCVKISVSHRGNTLFKNLSNEITAHQLTYATLAKLMGLSKVTVSAKMRGKIPFTERDKAKLVEIFDLPTEYLFQVID